MSLKTGELLQRVEKNQAACTWCWWRVDTRSLIESLHGSYRFHKSPSSLVDKYIRASSVRLGASRPVLGWPSVDQPSTHESKEHK